jgi:hypothetical protein
MPMTNGFGMTMFNALAATGNGGCQRHDHVRPVFDDLEVG